MNTPQLHSTSPPPPPPSPARPSPSPTSTPAIFVASDPVSSSTTASSHQHNPQHQQVQDKQLQASADKQTVEPLLLPSLVLRDPMLQSHQATVEPTSGVLKVNHGLLPTLGPVSKKKTVHPLDHPSMGAPAPSAVSVMPLHAFEKTLGSDPIFQRDKTEGQNHPGQGVGPDHDHSLRQVKAHHWIMDDPLADTTGSSTHPPGTRGTAEKTVSSLSTVPTRSPPRSVGEIGQATARQSTLQHLTNMGPLELEREIDSGVHLSEDIASKTMAEQDHLLQHNHHPSTSTLVSVTSQSSQSNPDTLLTLTKAEGTDQTDLTWSRNHPLLMDYSAEPESFDAFDIEPVLSPDDHHRPVHIQAAHLRHKGHSMSMDQDSSTHQPADISFFASGSGSTSRRRRNASRCTEDKGWSGMADNVRDQSQNTTEKAGKRVIIHQVIASDTLAGIALYYGIQVPVLKKSNKLWTNDSIHTRKYLYIPFEECSVARQSGALDEHDPNTVLLPPRSQDRRPSSARASYAPSSSSSLSPSISFEHGPQEVGQSSHTQRNQHQHLQLGLNAIPETSSSMGRSLESTSTTARGSTLSTSTPRAGTTWAKTLPAPSPSFTTTTLMSDNLEATPLSPRQNMASFSSPLKWASPAVDQGSREGYVFDRRRSSVPTVPFSENLPNTVMVAPSMTHEALTARFKEMDMIASERKHLGLEQELRTNPVHHRHKTTDLRQLAHLQQQQQQQQTNPGTDADGIVGAGSQRQSMDVSGNEKDAAPGYVSQECTQTVIARLDNDATFVKYGHHEHLYQRGDLPGSGHLLPRLAAQSPDTPDGHHAEGDELKGGGLFSQYSDHSTPTILRRQELVTVPAGFLSFFPSPEHSKRLETPQSISRLQNRMDSYSSSHSSSSVLSSPTGSRRLQRRGSDLPSSPAQDPGDHGTNDCRSDGVARKGRTALHHQTFQSPNPSSNSAGSSSSIYNTPAMSRKTPPVDKTNIAYPGSTAALSPGWSAMGESLVDDLMGAVRGPLEMARKMYSLNLAALGFGTGDSRHSKGDSLDLGFESHSSNNNNITTNNNGSSKGSSRLGRRSSINKGSHRTRHGHSRNKELRHSAGSLIELDQADHSGSNALSNRRMPLATSTTATSLTSTSTSTSSFNTTTKSIDPDSTMLLKNQNSYAGVRRKPSGGSGAGGSGHGSASSAPGDGHNSSVRKRSLRSSNPVNHAALMALVSELDKDKKEGTLNRATS